VRNPHGLLLGRLTVVSASPSPVGVQSAFDFETAEDEEMFIADLEEMDERMGLKRREKS